MAELLSDDEIREELPDEWRHDGDEIRRTFEFEEYLDGVAFARDVAELAEEEFHHPEITIGYKEVTVSFTSHEEGGVTNKDVRMARETNQRR